jgi:hypothetical protein
MAPLSTIRAQIGLLICVGSSRRESTKDSPFREQIISGRTAQTKSPGYRTLEVNAVWAALSAGFLHLADRTSNFKQKSPFIRKKRTRCRETE